MFSFLMREKDKSVISLVVDIGSGSVAASLVRLPSKAEKKDGELPHVLFTKRVSWLYDNQPKTAEFFIFIKKALDGILKTLITKNLPRAEKINVFLSSPWHTTQTRQALIERKKPFVCKERVVNELKSKEMEHILKSQNEQVGENEFEVMDSYITDIRLNGYQTSTPFNKKAEKLEITLLVSVAPKDILDNLRQVIGENLHVDDLKFHSFGVANYIVMRDIVSLDKDFLIVDVGGEVTDMIRVHNDIFEGEISFPLGYQFFYNSLARELGVTSREAKTLLSMFEEGVLYEKDEARIHVARQKVNQRFTKHLHDSFIRFSKNKLLPNAIFIASDSLTSDYVKDLFSKDEFVHYTKIGQPFNVINLNEQSFHSILRFVKHEERDVFTMIETIFLNRV